MAAPSYATNLTNIIEDMPNTTGWTLYSGGGGGANSLTAPETDDYIQGGGTPSCISRNPWTSANYRGMTYNSSQTITAGHAVWIWVKSDVTQALTSRAAGGIRVWIGSSSGNFYGYYVDGSDTAVKGGWICYPIDPRNGTVTPSETIGSPTTSKAEFGAGWSVATTGPSKGFPYKIDAIRHGDSITITAGDSGDPATWAKLATHSDNLARRWGIVEGTNSGASLKGKVNWGSATTSVYSRDSNRTIVLEPTLFVVSNFKQININHASTDLEWDNLSFLSLGTTSRGQVTISNNAKAWITNCAFADFNTIAGGGTNTKFDGTAFRRCNAVTSNGGSYLNCSFLTPTVAADASALIYNVATDPDGKLDGSTFSKGTNAHHAIEFGTSSPTTMTLRDMTFTGFSASDSVNDSTFYFKRTGGTVTLNLVGCAGNFSIKTDGCTVTKVINPVTTTVTVKNVNTFAAIQDAEVYVVPADGTGPLPYNASVTITRTGSVATVSHTAHGMSTNQKVLIAGANQTEYNGIQTITGTTTNTYDYTVSGSPTTPATGTITATGVLISATTPASGIVSDNRTLTSNQPISGWARKGTASPFYQQGNITGTVSSTAGLSLTVLLVPDE